MKQNVMMICRAMSFIIGAMLAFSPSFFSFFSRAHASPSQRGRRRQDMRRHGRRAQVQFYTGRLYVNESRRNEFTPEEIVILKICNEEALFYEPCDTIISLRRNREERAVAQHDIVNRRR